MILISAEGSWALWFVESRSWMLFAQSLNGTQWLYGAMSPINPLQRHCNLRGLVLLKSPLCC